MAKNIKGPPILLEDGTIWRNNSGSVLPKSLDSRDSFDRSEFAVGFDTPPVSLNLCSLCRNMLSSPDKIRSIPTASFATSDMVELCGGLSLCSGEIQCALRSLLLRIWKPMLEFRHEMFRETPLTVGMWDSWCRGTLVVSLQRRYEEVWHDIDSLWVSIHGPQDAIKFIPIQFRVCVEASDPASEFVTNRTLLIDSGLGALATRTYAWMAQCVNNHSMCPPAEAKPLPTRLVNVAVDADQVSSVDIVRLEETVGQVGKYAALSYCWGGPQPVCVTQQSLDGMKKAIEVSTLPRSLQDAVKVARSLRLKYLWVDCLCIIQDSPIDMESELRSMVDYYKNSFITISAARASSCQQGFLHGRARYERFYQEPVPRFWLPYRASNDEGVTGRVMLSLPIKRKDSFDDPEPINRRAWTLQERLLSPRLVVFERDATVWQCQAGTHDISPPVVGHERFAAARLIDAGFSEVPATIRPKELTESWIEVVEDYSRRELTHEDDKLVAISALASAFERLSEDVYLAGLWRKDLVRSLMWASEPDYLNNPRSKVYRAPTWSWACLDAGVYFLEVEGGNNYAEVLRCETFLKDEKLSTGQVTGGFLELRGLLVEIRLPMEEYDEDDEYEFSRLETVDTKLKAWMRLYLDSNDELRQLPVITLLRLTRKKGLALMRNKSSSTYRRIACFTILDCDECVSPEEREADPELKAEYETRPTGELACDGLFEGRTAQIITIV